MKHGMHAIQRFLPWFFCLFALGLHMHCGQDEGINISTQKEKIACRYEGLAERDGETIVQLVFINKTGKNIKAFYGGLEIQDEDGSLLQNTGFSYGMPFAAGAEKPIPAFQFMPLNEAAKAALANHPDSPPIVFDLSDIEYENGDVEKF